jgi:hypothetical protein
MFSDIILRVMVFGSTSCLNSKCRRFKTELHLLAYLRLWGPRMADLSRAFKGRRLDVLRKARCGEGASFVEIEFKVSRLKSRPMGVASGIGRWRVVK